jgi:cathepsin X
MRVERLLLPVVQLAALNDRIKIARKGAFPDVMLSRQAAMNCVTALSAPDMPPPGCNGGDPWSIHSYMSKHALPDESCQPYEAKNGMCNAEGQCRNCFHPEMVADPTTPKVEYSSPGCWAVPFVGFKVSEYGGVVGEAAMQKEILSRGPIVCSLAADATFLLDYKKHLVDSVYIDPTYFPQDGSASLHNKSEIDHDVEVTGWGVSARGVPYWMVRNSWGTYWGERGWFKLLRGHNHLFIEEDCQWAVIDASAFEENMEAASVGDYVDGKQTKPVDEASAGALRRRVAVATASTSATALAAEVLAVRAPAAGTAAGTAAGATAGAAASPVMASGLRSSVPIALTAIALLGLAGFMGALLRRDQGELRNGGRTEALLASA